MIGLKWIRKPAVTEEAKLREELRLALLGWEEEQAALDKKEAEVKRLTRELERARQQIDGQEIAFQTVSTERDNLKKLADNTAKELKATKDSKEVVEQSFENARQQIFRYQNAFNSITAKIEEAL